MTKCMTEWAKADAGSVGVCLQAEREDDFSRDRSRLEAKAYKNSHRKVLDSTHHECHLDVMRKP